MLCWNNFVDDNAGRMDRLCDSVECLAYISDYVRYSDLMVAHAAEISIVKSVAHRHTHERHVKCSFIQLQLLNYWFFSALTLNIFMQCFLTITASVLLIFTRLAVRT